MKITNAIIEKWFDKFNKEYWDGKLPKPAFKISSSSYRTLGRHSCQRGFLGSYNHTITMYNYYDRTEHNFQETLLHEMCHLYVAVTYNKGGHGYEWKREVARINQYGWNISRCTNLEEEGVKKVERRRNSKGSRIVGVLSMSQTDKFICCISRNADLERIKYGWLSQKPKFYEIIDESLFENFTTTGRGRSLRGKKVKDGSNEYKKYMKALAEM